MAPLLGGSSFGSVAGGGGGGPYRGPDPADFNTIVWQSNFEAVQGADPNAGFDDSNFNHDVNFNTTALATDDPKFDAKYLDGNAGHFHIPRQGTEFQIGAQDFTLEGFFKRNAGTDNAWLWSIYLTTGNQRSIGIQSNGPSGAECWMSTTGSSPSSVLNWGSMGVTATWRHFLLVRGSGTLSAFIAGARVATAANTTNLFASTADMYWPGIAGSTALDTMWDAQRLCVGEALYDPTETTIQVPEAYYNVG